MQILRARPLATATLLAISASVLSFFLGPIGKMVLLMSSLLALLALILLYLLTARRGLRFSNPGTALMMSILICMMTSVTVFASWYHFHPASNIPREIIDDNTTHDVSFCIVEEGNAGIGYTYYTVSLRSIDGATVRGRATLECIYTATYHVGDVLSAKVSLISLENYYDTDNLYYAISDGIRAVLSHEADAVIEKIGYEFMPVRRFFTDMRNSLSARLLSLTGKENGGLATALFLGDREVLDQRITKDFRRTGVSHLLALSGMHVTLLMGMVASLIVRVGIPKRGRLIILSVMLFVYLALIGFRLSAIRAAGMLLLFYISEMFGRRHDSLTTLCIIGWCILTAMPAAVVDGGFWMSFTAVLGLVIVLPDINDKLNSSSIPRRFHALVQGFAASLVAVISVSFCTWLFSGVISPIGVLLTVALTPILTCILILIPAVLLLDVLPVFSATPLALPLSFALKWMISLTSYVSEFEKVSFTLNIPYVGLILALMSVAMLVMLILPLRRKILLLFPPILAAVIVIGATMIWNNAQFEQQLQLNYVTRNNGSLLTVSDKEGTAIIDTSSGNYSVLSDAEKILRDQGMVEIEHLILTHYHRAHTYSTERLAKKWQVRYVWVPMPQSESEYLCLRTLYERLSPLGTEIRAYRPGEQITLFNDAVFSLADVTYIDRSSQPILTYLLQTPHTVLTFSTPTIQESSYYSTFRWIYERSDILLISEHGPKVKQALSVSASRILPDLIIADSEKAFSSSNSERMECIYLTPNGTRIRYCSFSMNK